MATTSTSADMQELGEKIENTSAFIEDIYNELDKVIAVGGCTRPGKNIDGLLSGESN
jgi:hypothetical protein